MAGPRTKEFMKRYQERLAAAAPRPASVPVQESSPVQERHDELLDRHTPPIAQPPDLNIPAIDPIFVERLRERALRAAERETRRLVREREQAERLARRRQREQEEMQRNTSDSFAAGRKVELDDES